MARPHPRRLTPASSLVRPPWPIVVAATAVLSLAHLGGRVSASAFAPPPAAFIAYSRRPAALAPTKMPPLGAAAAAAGGEGGGNGTTEVPAVTKGRGRKKRRKVTAAKTTEPAQPLYWSDDDDEVSMTGDAVRFTVRGKPVPLRRHRTSKGFMYNPSAKNQAAFRSVVEQSLGVLASPPSEAEAEPTFAEEDYLAVSLVFRMRRPRKHFVGSRAGPGRLRPTAPGRLYPTRTDVDNLAKFVLDSLIGLLYVDDKQVVCLCCAKVLDSEGLCEGATEVTVRRLTEQDAESIASRGIIRP